MIETFDLEKFMNFNHLRQSDVAKAIDVGQAFVSSVKLGRNKMPVEKIDRLINHSGYKMYPLPYKVVPNPDYKKWVAKTADDLEATQTIILPDGQMSTIDPILVDSSSGQLLEDYNKLTIQNERLAQQLKTKIAEVNKYLDIIKILTEQLSQK